MKSILTSIFVSIFFLISVSQAGNGYVFKGVGERLFAETILNIVTNIPFSTATSGQVVIFRAYPEATDQYSFQFSSDVDGVQQVLKPFSLDNTFEYVLPQSYTKVSITIQAKNLSNSEIIFKTLTSQKRHTLFVSKSRVNQKAPFKIFHSGIKLGQLYTVAFSDGASFQQEEKAYSISEGEITVRGPAYEGVEKVAVSIKELNSTERVKLEVIEGGAVSTDKDSYSLLEIQAITLIDDFLPSQDIFPAVVDGTPISLIKLNDNSLGWIVDNLSTGKHTLSFSIGGKDYKVEFNILNSEVISDPEGYVNGALTLINTSIGRIESDPNVSLEIKNKLRIAFVDVQQALQNLSGEEVLLVAKYIQSNPGLAFPARKADDLQAKQIGKIAEVNWRNIGILLGGLGGLVLTGVAAVKVCDLIPNSTWVCVALAGLTVLGTLISALYNSTLIQNAANSMMIFKKYAVTSEGLKFEHEVKKGITLRANYTNLNQKHVSSNSGGIIGLVVSSIQQFKIQAEHIGSVLGVGISAFDLAAQGEINTEDIVDEGSFSDLSVAKSNVNLESFLATQDGFEAILSSNESTDFELTIGYEDGIANGATNVAARINVVCDDIQQFWDNDCTCLKPYLYKNEVWTCETPEAIPPTHYPLDIYPLDESGFYSGSFHLSSCLKGNDGKVVCTGSARFNINNPFVEADSIDAIIECAGVSYSPGSYGSWTAELTYGGFNRSYSGGEDLFRFGYLPSGSFPFDTNIDIKFTPSGGCYDYIVKLIYNAGIEGRATYWIGQKFSVPFP